jgi:hypothetical protein
MNNKIDQQFMIRMNQHPQLRKRMEELLNVVENTTGDCTKADDAEEYVIEELRKMGNDALHCWANKTSSKASKELLEREKNLQGNSKKKILWHTTYGDIAILEPVFRRSGKQFRPFMMVAGVTSRSYSRPLERAVTDFGSDDAFETITKKLHEHYGIDIPTSSARRITEYHASEMDKKCKECSIPENIGCEQQIGETDGCMIPIVSFGKEEGDKRKQRILQWKEARLAMVHKQGSTTPKFDATYQKSVDDAGKSLLTCAVKAGFGAKTKMHAVSDGASWIANQVDEKFGIQGNYLVDFFHVCEYLAEAAKTCCPDDPRKWMDEQKMLLKNNEYLKVIKELKAHIEADCSDGKNVPVYACYRYLNNRTDQLNYKDAIKKELPIGSGEIESANRYVIQKRLKLAGAWWKGENVNPMLALRVVRANDEWDEYWKNLAMAA